MPHRRARLLGMLNETDCNSSNFDLVRATSCKRVCDVSFNTLKGYHRQGLPLYRLGGAVWFSKTELANFIREKAHCEVAGKEVSE